MSLHGDVASAIGQQVEQMILQAKKDSEARVRHDLSVTQKQMTHMKSQLTTLSERVQRVVRANAAGGADNSQTVDRAFLSSNIDRLEQKWGSEVKALKQDLHRTILAHNHNSDLMRHHRDALDDARRKLDAQTQPKAEQVDAQIEKVDRMLRAGQTKQRALDALTERLTTLEQQATDILANPAVPPGFPGMMPPGMPGMAAMMQPPIGQQRELATAKAGRNKKQPEAAEPPTEEEFRARWLQAANARQFNAEAPVFVPGGAAPGDGKKGGDDASEKADDDKSGGADEIPVMGDPIDLPPPAGLTHPSDEAAEEKAAAESKEEES